MHLDPETYLDVQDDDSPSPWAQYGAQLRIFRWFMVIVGSFYLSFLLWGPNLQAQWSLVDDHEILDVLGNNRSFSFFDIPHMVSVTEAGNFGKSVRFRPGYYFLRIVECFLWKGSPHAWYLARFVMFAMFVSIFVFLASRAAGLFLGVCLVLFALTAPYWPSIWACLGPAETYASFGCAIYSLGFYLLWKSLPPAQHAASALWDGLHWTLIAAGGFMAIGSKENFVLLALPVAWLAFHAYRKRALSVAGWIATAFTLTYATWISAAVIIALSVTGRDIYQASVSPASRIRALLATLGHASPVLLLCPVLGIVWTVVSLLKVKHSFLERWHNSLRSMFLMESVLLLAFVSQLYFYNGGWPKTSRYAFPGQLILEACVLAPIVYLLRKPELLPSLTLANARRLRNLFGVTLLFIVWSRGFEPAISASRQNLRSTRAVAETISRVQKATQGHADAAIVFLSCTLGDWESYYSVKEFIRSRAITNPIVLEKCPEGYSTAGFSPELAAKGEEATLAIEQGTDGFAPRALLDGPTKCFILGFSREPDTGRCESVGKLMR